MSQTKDQIQAHLDQARSDLNSNLHELEQRAVSAMDWRQHFDKDPGTLLAVAFGGGIALSLLFGGGRGRRRRSSASPVPQAVRTQGGNSELWDKVKGALIGVAAARVTDYVGRLIPGSENLENHHGQEHSSTRRPI